MLSQHPAAEARLHEELDRVLEGRPATMADLEHLEYTRQVFAESMRLYPPAYGFGRQAIHENTVGGYRIRKGTIVIISPYVTHRDPHIWPQPERFDPSRWTPEAMATRHKFAYCPFGGGVRKCIGESFAWMEGILVLATLAQHWKMRLAPGFTPALDPKVTLRPKGGMPMSVYRRESV
jgi:cytochrome P450